MSRLATVRTFATDVGGVLATWIAFLALENLVVGVAERDQFAGSWEMAHARYFVSPVAIAAVVPLAVAVVALGSLWAARRATALVAFAFAVGGALAYGVSGGRHFASWAVRAPFMAVVAALAAALTFLAVRRVPLDRPRSAAVVGALVASLAWLADALVLRRLYPALHLGLFGVALAGCALTYLAFRNAGRVTTVIAVAALATAAVCAARVRVSARMVARDDNLRRVLVETAPLLGRAVLVAARIAPPAPLDDDATDTAVTAAAVTPKTGARALDWTGRDIVVVTIDALRADHVSAYGYPRATTPNIDRLAARGTRFEHAYCPTPHTSYSVASMMTGKYMRPLLAIGAGDDSETWASYLRHYGFRTAAFYPPAVFFIDEHRFRAMQQSGLGFEYKKEEFAAPALRRQQVAEYVASAPRDKPLFLWVHLFEPHEPYVRHPEHPFEGEASVDAYDSEVAAADAVVGSIVEEVERRRPNAVFVVSADHGEEFGDHGGRYHGTTVYEEQVRVPLVVAGPGVATRVVATPVQTIDLLPTTLSALDVPPPARVRGRDLGAVLAGTAPAKEDGLAFAETDDYTLLARGDHRLVCVRKIASCTLYDVARDPRQQHPVEGRRERVAELRRLTAAIERENGRLEASALPEALRRGLQGDRDAAEDVAALLDDARVDIRREAARCLFRLIAEGTAQQLRRALARDEDADVRKWSALALVRLGDALGVPGAAADAGAGGAAGSLVESLLHDPDARFRLAAGVALATRGDARGESELVKRWEAAFVPGASGHGELEEARELLEALAKLRTKSAAPVLARSLEDVRLRPYVVEALGAIGDARAKEPLLAAFAEERYVHVREKEARALVLLGAKEELRAPLARFAGVPEPLPNALDVAKDAGLLVPARGGWVAPDRDAPPSHVDVELGVAGSGPARLLALGAEGAPLRVTVDGADVTASGSGPQWAVELPAVGPRTRVVVDHAGGTRALWVVRRADEIPPPAPKPVPPASEGREGGL